MKTTLVVTITSALVLLTVASAQFGPAQPPVALPQPETVPADSGTLKITSPEATLELAPEPKVAAPPPMRRSKAPAVGQNRFGQPGAAPGGLPSVKVASSASRQVATGVGASQTPAQMLLQSEVKVMRRHYENVLQRALEAEEKSHVATTDSDGNAKAQPDADAASHRDRAAVLRRYAEQLQNAIAAKASELASQEATMGRDYAPVPEVTVRGNGSDASAEYKKALKEYPKSGISNAPTTTPPQINGYSGESSNKKALLTDLKARGLLDSTLAVLDAQVRAQRAALNAEKIGLDEVMEDLKRAEPAYEQKVISAEEFSHKQYAVKKAQARLEKLEAEIAATEAERAISKAQLQRTPPPKPAVPGIPAEDPESLPPATPENPPTRPPTPAGR
jgi:hypothetical protein